MGPPGAQPLAPPPSPLQACYVLGCSDVTIVVGAVGRLLRLERCDKVQVRRGARATTRQIRAQMKHTVDKVQMSGTRSRGGTGRPGVGCVGHGCAGRTKVGAAGTRDGARSGAGQGQVGRERGAGKALPVPPLLPALPQVIAAASRVLVNSCTECSLALGTPRPPLLVGDCRFLRLGPLNAR
jgi:hypothetical protein